jgi:hypothetical protein
MIPLAVVKVVDSVLDKFVEDKDLKLQLEHELKNSLNQANLAQIDVNKTEAQHHSMFVAGWRPAIGWVAAIGFAYTFVLQPFLQWIMVMQGVEAQLPEINTEILFELVIAMLGMAGLRSFEKLNGVSRK